MSQGITYTLALPMFYGATFEQTWVMRVPSVLRSRDAVAICAVVGYVFGSSTRLPKFTIRTGIFAISENSCIGFVGRKIFGRPYC